MLPIYGLQSLTRSFHFTLFQDEETIIPIKNVKLLVAYINSDILKLLLSIEEMSAIRVCVNLTPSYLCGEFLPNKRNVACVTSMLYQTEAYQSCSQFNIQRMGPSPLLFG